MAETIVRDLLAKPFRTGSCFYAYDTNSNAIAEIGEAVYGYLRDPMDLSPGVRRAVEQRIEGTRQTTGLFKPFKPNRARPFFDNRELRDRIRNHRKSLMLQVTDACNMRCAYCVYGGDYDGRPLHGKKLMPFKVARKAIDDFMAHAGKTEGELALGFYGGEPLVNRKLLQRALGYLRTAAENRETVCALTTNGTLLDDAAVDFLVENRIAISVSLDGPKAIHDRFRVTVKGDGTFKTVVSNLLRFRQRHPVFFDAMARLSVTLVPPVDFIELDRFFGDFPVKRINVSHVESFGSPHREGASMDRSNYSGGAALRRQYVEAAITGNLASRSKPTNVVLADAMFGPTIQKIHNRELCGRLPEEFTPAGLCVPGADKTYVNVSGQYYVCEKVDGNKNMVIGNVETGIDEKKVIALSHDFYTFLGDTCRDCWASRLCGICFAHTVHDNALDMNKRVHNCDLKRQHLADMFALYCEIREQNPDAFAFLDR